MAGQVPPLWFRFDGRVMVPEHPSRCASAYKAGEAYRLVPHDERTDAEQNFYMAAVADAHRNLPEHLAARFPTPRHLRKYALIHTGFCDHEPIVAATPEAAERIAAWAQRADTFAVITVDDNVVTRHTAWSQSYRTMGKEEFRASKTAVLDFLVAMLGTSRNALENNTRSAA